MNEPLFDIRRTPSFPRRAGHWSRKPAVSRAPAQNVAPPAVDWTQNGQIVLLAANKTIRPSQTKCDIERATERRIRGHGDARWTRFPLSPGGPDGFDVS